MARTTWLVFATASTSGSLGQSWPWKGISSLPGPPCKNGVNNKDAKSRYLYKSEVQNCPVLVCAESWENQIEKIDSVDYRVAKLECKCPYSELRDKCEVPKQEKLADCKYSRESFVAGPTRGNVSYVREVRLRKVGFVSKHLFKKHPEIECVDVVSEMLENSPEEAETGEKLGECQPAELPKGTKWSPDWVKENWGILGGFVGHVYQQRASFPGMGMFSWHEPKALTDKDKKKMNERNDKWVEEYYIRNADLFTNFLDKVDAFIAKCPPLVCQEDWSAKEPRMLCRVEDASKNTHEPPKCQYRRKLYTVTVEKELFVNPIAFGVLVNAPTHSVALTSKPVSLGSKPVKDNTDANANPSAICYVNEHK
jgi:hypothetical protein